MTIVPLDRLLGREVHAPNGARVGRLEEFRARKQGTGLVVEEFVIGAAGVLERMNLWARMLVGWRASGYVATFAQLDLSEPCRPRLRCRVEELREL